MDQRLIVSLLMLTLCFVAVIGVFLVYLVLRSRHVRNLAALEKKMESDPSEAVSLQRLTLKHPDIWLAVKSCNPHAIQTALALHNSKPCSWAEGLSDGSEQKLFISPSISGWVLVIGPALPDPVDDVDACFRFLLEISRKLGHVQFFHANCVLNHHAWAQAESGRILRGYAWAGKTLWNQGAMTIAEQELRLKCYDYLEAAPTASFTSHEPMLTNADKVHLLAARWSVDPEDIDERRIPKERGIVGQPSRRF